MPGISLNPTCISYRYENCALIRSNPENPLLLSYIKKRASFKMDTIILNFSCRAINFSLMQFKNGILELPLEDLPTSNLHSKMLCVSYSFTNSLTLQDAPMSFFNYRLSNDCFYYNSIRLNVTSIIKDWKKTGSPILQIKLSINRPNLCLKITNTNYIVPRLHIDYEDCEIPTPPTPEKKTRTPMLSLACLRHTCEFIRPNKEIIFDITDSDFLYKIQYSTDTGHFTFNLTGYYLIQWTVHLVGSASPTALNIGIIDYTTGATSDFQCPSVLPCQIYGQYIVHITDPTHEYALVNLSDARLQLSNVGTQASLIICQISPDEEVEYAK